MSAPEFTPLEMVPLRDRHCWRPRQDLFDCAAVKMSVRRAGGSAELDIAEWHLARVRRRHLHAVWADEASVA